MEELKKITVHNKIANTYREIHVDGAFGGITPRGLVNLSFYAERTPIPKSSEFSIVDGKIGELITNSDDSKSGILREFEFGIYTDINVAKSLIKLITDKVKDFEDFQLKNKP